MHMIISFGIYLPTYKYTHMRVRQREQKDEPRLAVHLPITTNSGESVCVEKALAVFNYFLKLIVEGVCFCSSLLWGVRVPSAVPARISRFLYCCIETQARDPYWMKEIKKIKSLN